MSEFLEVDPRKLRLPPSRRDGADPAKLQRQIAKHGKATDGMPPLIVHRGKDGELMIYDGVTRATRVAKLLPGQTITVEVAAAPKQGLHEISDRGGETTMNTTRGSLVIALSRLGLLYPSMRLGQLLEMLVTMAGAESVAEFEVVSDDRLVQAATDHIAGRAAQLDQMVIQKAENSMERQQILASLARMVDDDPRLMRVFAMGR